jgi:hypothetical protein
MADTETPYLQLMAVLAELDTLATTMGPDALLAGIPVANLSDPEEVVHLRAYLLNAISFLHEVQAQLEAGRWTPTSWPEMPAQQ